jgi:hypothetical protein
MPVNGRWDLTGGLKGSDILDGIKKTRLDLVI